MEDPVPVDNDGTALRTTTLHLRHTYRVIRSHAG